jgi:GAF domain-containing protein
VSQLDGGVAVDQLDRELLRSIAAYAGLALELAETRRYNETARRLTDRARIADNLRQQVVDRLVRHALTLQDIAGRTGPDTAGAIQQQVDEVDAIIREFRATISSIDPPVTEVTAC